MKTFIKIISFIILSFIMITKESYTQSGWELQLGGNTSFDSQRRLTFTNINTGWMADVDKIRRTTNAGTNWSILYTDSTKQFSDIHFLNDITGFITRYNGSVWKSTNGGANWSLKLSSAESMNAVFFTSSLTGWCVGGNGLIYKTTNAGENWVVQSSGSIDDLNAIYFVSAETGWVVGNWGTIVYTTNGGSNWSTQNSNTVSFLNSVHFVSASKGWACGTGGRILGTTDGGITWISNSAVTSSNLNSIHFISESEGWAFGNSGTILKTFDGGASWIQQNAGINMGIGSSAFPGGNNIYLAGQGSAFFRSTNSGTSWDFLFNESLVSHTLRSIYFINYLTGLSAGNSGTIVKTTNGGTAWTLLNSGTTKYLNSIFFVSENTGWAVGGRFAPGSGFSYQDTNIILLTTNGGINWNVQFTDTTGSLNSVFFANQSYGWTVGRNGLLLRTTNGGANWITGLIDTGYNYALSVFFISQNTGWVSYNAYVFKTTNAGISWISQGVVTGGCRSLYFVNSLTGWIASSFSRVCKTTNGGSNWSCQLIPGSNSFYGISFLTSEIGLVVGRNLFKSTNGGANWVQEISPLIALQLHSVFFTPQGNGWACGDNGTIIHKTEVIGINIISSEVPEHFWLYQNYPNPFNPVTKIRFSVPAGAQNIEPVQIIIYDALGREVATLVNEKLSPGTYEADWDAENFASGVYFYELKTGEFTQVKKLVLIK